MSALIRFPAYGFAVSIFDPEKALRCADRFSQLYPDISCEVELDAADQHSIRPHNEGEVKPASAEAAERDQAAPLPDLGRVSDPFEIPSFLQRQ